MFRFSLHQHVLLCLYALVPYVTIVMVIETFRPQNAGNLVVTTAMILLGAMIGIILKSRRPPMLRF